MRHPDWSRIDTGEDFFEVGRVGRFSVGHMVPFPVAIGSIG
jgi:hypothetical protein